MTGTHHRHNFGSRQPPATFARVAVFWGAALMCTGCGDTREGVVQVEGRVQYGGVPVATGRIDFLPQGVDATPGRQGYAMIREGRFDTQADGRGLAPGKYLARLSGFEDSDPKDAESNFGSLLFQGYEQEIVISSDREELLFDVPRQGTR